MMVNYYPPAVLLFYKEDNNADSVLPANSSALEKTADWGRAGSKEDRENEARKEKIMRLRGTSMGKVDEELLLRHTECYWKPRGP